MPRADFELEGDGTRSFRRAAATLELATATDPNAAFREPPSPDTVDLWHERFKIGSKLGEGGMGVVYRAHDTRDGRDVALKLMKGAIAGTARRRFEREFRSLSALRHPHCLGVYDYGELGGGPFFTMELFLGHPITWLTSRPLAERLDPLMQLTHALDYIHSHGIVHRDVKPSNVLVRSGSREDGSPQFETRLMDFGLAKYYGVKSSLSAEAGFVGTVAYCAPEQINLDELDHRADLYCLGLVAYEVLSGRYAFPEARLAGMRPLMQAQLNDKPKPLADVNSDVPAPIAEVVMKYLRKQPRRRPDSAAQLRAAIANVLGVDTQSMVTGISIPQSRPTLAVTGFVCRTSEQEALEGVIRRCLRPTSHNGEIAPSAIVVTGEPGIGKSSVVQEAERLARGHGCQVYEGRCFDGNLSPFQPFVEILRQLIAELRLQERREQAAVDEDLTGTHVAGLPAESLVRLLGIVNDYRGELLRIAPELRKYLPGEAYQHTDYGLDGEYIHRALAAFFMEIATFQPVCLSFEDLQWADKSSLDLLRHLAAALAAARHSLDDLARVPKLVIVASARTGYPSLENLLAQLRDQQHLLELRLEPLTEQETRELIALRLNCQSTELADDLVNRVHVLCGGNPFFVAETVRDWFDKQVITQSEPGWVMSMAVGDSTDLPETVRDVMRLRVQGLTPKAQQVLGAAAVIGAVVEIDLLAEVLPELSESDILDAIDQLLPRRVFRETGNAGRVEFVHDLLRELPYAELSAARRRSLHRRAGEVLEQKRSAGQTVPSALLADHFRNADDAARGLTYTVEAAQAALDAYAFSDAIARLDTALSLLPADANHELKYRVWKMMGTARRASGKVDGAIEAFNQALAFATDWTLRANIEEGLGEAFHRKGEFKEAARHFDTALREIGYPRRQSFPAMLVDMMRPATYFHVLPSWLHLPDIRSDAKKRIEVAFAHYERLARVFAGTDLVRYSYCSYKMAGFAKHLKQPEMVTIGYSKIGFNFALFALGGLGLGYIDQARQASQLCQRTEVLWPYKAHLGIAYYCLSRLDEAEDVLHETVVHLDKVGDWFGAFAHHILRHVYTVRCDIPRELAEAEAEVQIGTTCGDRDIVAWGHYGKAGIFARTGRIDEAMQSALLAVDHLTKTGAWAVSIAEQVLGFVRLQASDYAGARAALERSAAIVIRTMSLIEFVAPVYALLPESLLGPNWADSSGYPNRKVARKAWRESGFARFIGRCYRNCGPHGLRVSGRAAFALGKRLKAARYFEQSIQAAEKLGARYDLARAYLDASRVIAEKSVEYSNRGQRLLDELGAVVPEAERISS